MTSWPKSAASLLDIGGIPPVRSRNARAEAGVRFVSCSFLEPEVAAALPCSRQLLNFGPSMRRRPLIIKHPEIAQLERPTALHPSQSNRGQFAPQISQ
jgi:hypothetical protein